MKRPGNSSRGGEKQPLSWKRHGLPVLLSCAIGLAVYFLCVALWCRGKFQYTEFHAYDLLIRAQPKDTRVSSDVVILGIDELDLRALGHYPVTDNEKAMLFQRLIDLGAVAVGSDVYLDLAVPDERVPDGRKHLKDLLLSHRTIICPEKYAGEGSVGVSAPDFLTNPFRTRRIGAVDQPVDPFDGTIRKAFVYLGGGGERTVPSLSLGVANQFLEADGTLKIDQSDPIHLRFWLDRLPRCGPDDGAYVNADSAGYQYLVDYGGAADFTMVHLRQLLPSLPGMAGALTDQGETPLAAGSLKGKVVFVGMTAESVKDFINTPLQLERFGVEQHGTLFDQLVRTAKFGSSPRHAWPPRGKALYGLFWMLAGVVAGSRIRSAPALYGVILAGLLAHGLLVYLLFRAGVWIPAVAPAVCWLLTAASVMAAMRHLEREERNVLMGIFGKAVAPRIAQELWNNREHLVEHGALRPQVITATILFTDLENFTTFSEKIGPAELITWLNAYIGEIAGVIESCDGVVAKYMGDSVMAMFGAPNYREDSDEKGIAMDARNAVECALLMRQTMARLTEEWTRNNQPCPRMRVGILTGKVVAGSLGSRDRLEYVTLGDTTNTASRLESYSKDVMDSDISAHGCRILIGEPTKELVDPYFVTREIGRIQLKGKQLLVGVFGVLGRKGPPRR